MLFITLKKQRNKGKEATLRITISWMELPPFFGDQFKMNSFPIETIASHLINGPSFPKSSSSAARFN